jgi:hypothetical protein
VRRARRRGEEVGRDPEGSVTPTDDTTTTEEST